MVLFAVLSLIYADLKSKQTLCYSNENDNHNEKYKNPSKVPGC